MDADEYITKQLKSCRIDTESIQKYKCKECKKNFLETNETVYHGKHFSQDFIDQIVTACCEGLRNRVISRLFKISRNTVLEHKRITLISSLNH